LRPDKRKEEAREVERGRKEEAGSEWGPSESSQRGESAERRGRKSRRGKGKQIFEGSREIPVAEEEKRERSVGRYGPAGRPDAHLFLLLVDLSVFFLPVWSSTLVVRAADMRPRSMVAGAAGVSWCAGRASPWICVFPVRRGVGPSAVCRLIFGLFVPRVSCGLWRVPCLLEEVVGKMRPFSEFVFMFSQPGAFTRISGLLLLFRICSRLLNPGAKNWSLMQSIRA